jgi:small subunit ribosomal protein S3
MGQKVNPHGLRVGVIKGWDATWYADKKNFGNYLVQDHKIRQFVKKKYYTYGISRITIERSQGKCTVSILTSKPGMIIGQKGAGVEQLKKEVSAIVKGDAINVNIQELKQPDKDATLVAESVASQLEKRSSFRRTMKQAMMRTMRAGAKGVKIMVSGRLDGAEIARSEHYHEGSIPLQTLRADIDYGTANAHTTFGIIGVKVWIYKGEVLGKSIVQDESVARDNRPRPNRTDRSHGERSRAPKPQDGAPQSDKPQDKAKSDRIRNDKASGDRNNDRGQRGARRDFKSDKSNTPNVPRVQKVSKPAQAVIEDNTPTVDIVPTEQDTPTQA